MGTNNRNVKFVEVIAPRPKTQTEHKRRVRSLSSSSAILAVTWLNAANGTAAFSRVLEVRTELTELGAALDKTKWKPRAIKPGTREEIVHARMSEANRFLLYSQERERFRVRHNALNQRLARYAYVPALAYGDTGVWRFAMVPMSSRGPHVVLESDGVPVEVSEASVVAALCRLAASRELYKIKLCETCGLRWRVAERRMDRFCSQKCREAFHTNSDEYREKKAEHQRQYRERNVSTSMRQLG